MAIILHTEPSAFRLLPNLMPEVQVHKTVPANTPLQPVLRWGSVDGRDTDGLVINRLEALQNISRAAEFWRVNQLPVGSASNSYYRRYRYYMFELLPIRVLRREIGHSSVTEISVNSSKEARDAANLAARTLHTVGLDFGMVEIGVDNKGRQVIIGVNIAPRLTRVLAQAYAEPIRKRLREADLRQTIPLFQRANPSYLERVVSIGADPEFMLQDARTRRMVMASRFFPKSGPVGCDARFVRGTVTGHPLGELRPEPSYSPIELTDNIRNTMNRALRQAPYTNVHWLAGSMPFSRFPIGGHIHFGGVPLSGQLLRALDNYLAVPLMLIEDPATARRRRKKYGYLGDFRVKNHGGFEYRTPASWLVSPRVATAALCLAKVIASEYHVLKRDIFLNPDAQEAFLAINRDFFLPHFAVVWAELRQTPTFGLYASHLEIIETMVQERETWRERVDIRKAWDLNIPRGRVYRP